MARVAENPLVDLGRISSHLLHLLAVEIVHHRRSMMLADDIDETLRQVVFAREGLAFRDVGDDHMGRFSRGQQLMDVESSELIFCEVMGVKEFPNVVIEG